MHTAEIDSGATRAKEFCERFLSDESRPRLVLGTNKWADSIANAVDIDAFIDDFAASTTHEGKPIFKMEAVPQNALVVSAVVGVLPLTAARRLDEFELENLDYYAFSKYAGLSLLPVLIHDEFGPHYAQNKNEFDWVRSQFADEESRRVYDKLIGFRLSSSLAHLSGFTDCQDRQYFEDFLGLNEQGEVFVDVGGYDGYTSLEFAKRYPQYEAIHVFEPDERNFALLSRSLQGLRAAMVYPLGLSDRNETLSFSSNGSSSSVSESGSTQITVDRLDDILKAPVTFMKMDIEGAEGAALAGARDTIIRSHPVLAVCVYHRCDDFHTIPRQILSYRSDYAMYLRHYTEGVTETVMFFVPNVR